MNETKLGGAPETKFKRNLMSEFSALYCHTQPKQNMSIIEQASEETIKVTINHYKNVESYDITIFDEFNRLRFFGWQLRCLKYTKEGNLELYFEKVDWRSVGFYHLIPDKYNNEKDIWWL